MVTIPIVDVECQVKACLEDCARWVKRMQDFSALVQLLPLLICFVSSPPSATATPIAIPAHCGNLSYYICLGSNYPSSLHLQFHGRVMSHNCDTHITEEGVAVTFNGPPLHGQGQLCR